MRDAREGYLILLVGAGVGWGGIVLSGGEVVVESVGTTR